MSARASRLNRGQLSRQPAIRARGAHCANQKKPEHQIPQTLLKEQVSADILELPIKTVGRITGASLDTIKGWRSGRRFPSPEYLELLCPHFESVQRYVAQRYPAAVTGDPIGDIAAGLLHLAQTEPPQQAAIYRAALAAYLQRIV